MGASSETGDTDRFVAELMEDVARRLTSTGLTGAQLRERRHLDPFVKDEWERRTGQRPLTRTLRTDAFPGVGGVDVVSSDPAALVEFKWSPYGPRGKVYESLWDASGAVRLDLRLPLRDDRDGPPAPIRAEKNPAGAGRS